MNASNDTKPRLIFIDALRGLAVLLMMEQNIGIWLWRPDGPMHFFNHPFLYSLNGIGGLAGPLFITLAGISAALFVHTHPLKDRTLILRGVVIMLFGYLMNFLTPGFFSMGSWFTLHIIGFAILLTPLFRRLPTSHVILLSLIITLTTGWLHSYLDTPYALSEYRMRALNYPGGMFRLMMAEGHYPIFPWLAFFLAGFVTGRLFLENRTRQILQMGLICFALAVAFLIPMSLGTSVTAQKPWALFFRLNLGSFPTPPLFVLLFFPLVAILFLLFHPLTVRLNIGRGHFLVSLGRISLTLQIVHVVIFYEVFQRLRWFRTFSTVETLSIVFGVLLITAFLSTRWCKHNYVFSCEWIMRRITDPKLERGVVKPTVLIQ